MPVDQIAEYQVKTVDFLILSILVLFTGLYLTKKIRFLADNYIPAPVTGGLIFSLVTALIYKFGNLQISFDMELRNVLLLVFFSTIGLSAKFKSLVSGGKALAILVAVAGVFLVIQDATGVLIAVLFGVHPGYGLLGGSVSFAGGHGTAIAWGGVAEAAGLAGAAEIGIAFATFGLIAGGLIGGPIAGRLIAKHNLRGPSDEEAETVERMTVVAGNPLGLREHLGTILVLAICVGLGNLVNQLIFAKGVLLPGFLTSLLVGVLLTNLADLLKMKLSMTPIDAAGEVSLSIFLSMSMMSMQLWTLAGALGPIMLVLIVQVLVMTVFAVFIVFNLMGRDYDACVITSGFAGLGLGATPVAIANMTAVTARFGPSPKAFLVVPLVGAFFIDLLNASVIKFFIAVITRFLT